MIDADDALTMVRPREVLKEIIEAIPGETRRNLIIIGSLAAGIHFEDQIRGMAVRTKDADCLLSPYVEAVGAGRAITEELLQAGWTPDQHTRWTTPSNAITPLRELPVVRLLPPSGQGWFLELLTVPESAEMSGRSFTILKTSRGYFVLPSFGGLALAAYAPDQVMGIAVAKPEMMALANMLEHADIRPETMSGRIGGREIKRSNKDLGRVLAIAYLAEIRDEDALMKWPEVWFSALRSTFGEDFRDRASRAGTGIRTLISPSHVEDLDEAHHTCVYGLLASNPPARDQLRMAGERLLVDAIEPLQVLAE